MSNSTTLDRHERVRSEVSKRYAQAVSNPAPGGCCGATASAGCGAASSKSLTVQTAGYEDAELSALPADAVVNSFGCGNPLAFSEVREGDVVLDLGSGAGIDLLIAAKKVGPSGRVIGVDMTDAMIERARRNIAASGAANIEVRKGIIEDLPVESGTVDWVISNCVINLSPDKPKVFSEIARVLKPGGRMSVSDIVAQDLPWWIRRSMKLYSACIGGAISEDAYVAGLRAAGLVDVEVRDRLVYEREHIEGFVREILPPFMGGLAKPLQVAVARLLVPLAGTVAGKIWSAKFYAMKPAVGAEKATVPDVPATCCGGH
jgi:SAM-dependent methyltransferase